MTTIATTNQTGLAGWMRKNSVLVVAIVLAILLPFFISLIEGQSISSMLGNETGQSKFIQGLMIEIFILGIFALSYDLVFGITGLLSFGHAMFFGVGAYLTGILLKSFELGLLPTVALVIVAGILQALLFSVVLPRVHGITFALVTLGLAAVFEIVIKSRELMEFAGAEVGLQGIPKPEYLDPADQRLRMYYLTLLCVIAAYLIYRRFVDSPTGRVCVAIRENEDRALMLGYNTFYFKLIVLIVSSITAALAGTLHALHQPLISPNVASLGYTIIALLIILIGGVGTLSGAFIGAGAFRLLEFFLDKWFGENASFLLGVVYIGLVLFLPYGIVGTWQLRSANIRAGWSRLTRMFTARGSSTQ